MNRNVASSVCSLMLPVIAAGFVLAPDTVMAAKYVRLTTSQGAIVLELDDAKAPGTVKNFLDYTDSAHFDGTIFHRVIAGFMIQGGGVLPDGSEKKTNDPIQNEADNGLKNDRYTIAMARTGDPHSATSQFFINVADNTRLNHTWKDPNGWGYCVFGRVIDGFDTVEKIRTTKVKPNERGENAVPLETITLAKAERVSDAEASTLAAGAAERRKQAEAAYPAPPDPQKSTEGEAMSKFVEQLHADAAKATKTDSGLMYLDLKVGDGPEAAKGQSVEVHYTGWLTNGTQFDSSVAKNKPLTFGGKGDMKVIEGWNQGVVGMKVGGKRKLIIPPELAYKAVGRPPVIPGNATLVFEMELLAIK